jgi:hypothetical protein
MYEIKSGSHISVENGKTVIFSKENGVQTLEPCPKPFLRKNFNKKPTRDSPDEGWQVWTAYNNENNATFTSFIGYFNVPDDPPNWDGGILYMFTGLQNDNWVPIPSEPNTPAGFDIIQPVLQYGGDSEDGGGDYWALASWYVTVDENVLYSTLEQVNAGDIIYGNMTKIGPTEWYIGGIVQSAGINTYITYDDPRLDTQPWAYCTLEVYDIDDCDADFPPKDSPMKFTGMKLYDSQGLVVPSWQALDNEADHCGAVATVQNPQTVTITF